MKKALIIAADAELRSALADWVTVDGFEAVVAWDSFIGLKFAQAEQPDLILCDVNMPDLDGFALLDELQLNPAEKKPFTVLIGQLADSSRAFAAGADGFLFKSAALEGLLRSIQRYTRSISLNRESQ